MTKRDYNDDFFIQRLSLNTDNNPNVWNKKETVFAWGLMTVVALFSVFFGVVLGPLVEFALTYHSENFTISNVGLGKPIISIYNEYTIDKPLSGYYDWENIVEPYRATYLTVSNPTTDSGFTYHWFLDGWFVDTGESIQMTFTAPTGALQTVSVEIHNSTDHTVHNSSLQVMCKYVRREIRSLLEQDRLAFLQAVSIMQRVPTQAGKALYGRNYRSRDFFTRMHLYYGGAKTCDHWHQGPGFVVTHFTYSLMFERSLQSVNPAVALPYWDFTLESTFYEPDSFRESYVFSEDWFGAASPDSADHSVDKGRFARVPVMRSAQNYSVITSPYGMMRSPWNADTTPYMTRSGLIYGLTNNLKPSGCAEYSKALTYRDWTTVAKVLNANAHGHIHELLGGSWGASREVYLPDSAAQSGYTAAYEFAHSTEAYSKILWRYNYLVCPEGNATSSYSTRESRVCYCDADKMRASSAAQILFTTGILNSLVFYDKKGVMISQFENSARSAGLEVLPSYTARETAEIYAEVLDMLCEPGFMGDMFQATSPNDVTFWVLHPTMERMWHLLRLNQRKGLIAFNDTWPDGDSNVCPGHLSTSTTPFKNIFDSDNALYTNSRLYELLHPSRDKLPYVYDTFEWPHCTLLGYNMVGY